MEVHPCLGVPWSITFPGGNLHAKNHRTPVRPRGVGGASGRWPVPRRGGNPVPRHADGPAFLVRRAGSNHDDGPTGHRNADHPGTSHDDGPTGHCSAVRHHRAAGNRPTCHRGSHHDDGPGSSRAVHRSSHHHRPTCQHLQPNGRARRNGISAVGHGFLDSA